jgi:RNA polymerase sigma-70 factor (ECF subfamily)
MLYDRLVAQQNSQLVRLNRAVALAEVRDPAVALAEVQELDGERLTDYAPYHAVCADLYRRCGDAVAAGHAYDKAISLVTTHAERNWLSAQRAKPAI